MSCIQAPGTDAGEIMTNSKRVFITGLSALTSTGENLSQTWDAVLAGRTGLDIIKGHDLTGWTHRLGGELKDFKPAASLPDRKMLKVISPHDVYGINAAMQAVSHSTMLNYRDSLENAELFNEQTGIFVGSPGNKYYQTYDFLPLVAKSGSDMKIFAESLFSEVHPMWLLRILPNNVLAYTGIHYGFKGANHNITNHATSGMQAIIEAWHAIKAGQIERAVVVAYDMGTDPQNMFYYAKLGILSENHLKPFDLSHNGTLLADGAAAMVLESEESVLARNALPYAEIMAGAAGSDAQGLFALEEDGAPLATLIENIVIDDLSMIVAHGNGNIKSDISEAAAISKVFGEKSIPVTAFKWSTGHTLSSSGLLDTVLATCALNNKLVPGIANFNASAKGCESLSLSSKTSEIKSSNPAALIINRGFAGMNALVVIKSCE